MLTRQIYFCKSGAAIGQIVKEAEEWPSRLSWQHRTTRSSDCENANPPWQAVLLAACHLATITCAIKTKQDKRKAWLKVPTKSHPRISSQAMLLIAMLKDSALKRLGWPSQAMTPGGIGVSVGAKPSQLFLRYFLKQMNKLSAIEASKHTTPNSCKQSDRKQVRYDMGDRYGKTAKKLIDKPRNQGKSAEVKKT